MQIDQTDQEALRACAQICWQRREELHLTPTQVESVLIAWMSVGTPSEGEAASELLQALRKAERKQANFDRLLSP